MEYKLSDIFDLQMGKTPDRQNREYWTSGTESWISIADLSKCDKYIYETAEHITRRAVHESGIKIIPANTVIMSFKLSIGKLAITPFPMYSNEAIMAFMNKNVLEIDPTYLYYLLMHRDWSEGINKAVMGKTLNKATLSQVKIKVHSPVEQARIVQKLEKVRELITFRKQQLTELDNLIKARFVEMFGDPKINGHKWLTINIGDLIQSCESGWSGNGTQRIKKPGEIAVLKVSSVTRGFFIPEECKVLDDQYNIKKYVFPEKGDLLFSRANTQEMVGATAVIFQDYPELILPDKLWKIRFADCANVLYMKYLLSHRSVRSKFSAVSTGTSGSMYNVSMEKFKSIVVPLPSIELQQQFAAFVAQVDKSKVAVQAALDKAQMLFDSLMQQYFG